MKSVVVLLLLLPRRFIATWSVYALGVVRVGSCVSTMLILMVVLWFVWRMRIIGLGMVMAVEWKRRVYEGM
jgi:hypothetical protein